MPASIATGLTGLLLAAGFTRAIDLDVNNTDSVTSASKTIVGNILDLYRGANNSDRDIPGLFGDPYYWWESGLAFDSLINYWSKSGDDSVVQTIQDALLFQIGPNDNYMPPNQSRTLGNDDQASWALAAMTAAESGFPQRDGQVSWIELATNVFNDQVRRWDESSCGGGLKWQIFAFNNGYNYKNSATQGSFALLAARLARYTGNVTYSDWARRSVEWSSQVGLFDNQTGVVYDGTDDTTNCSDINHIQWTINAGLLIDAGAYMTNTTQSNSAFWGNTLWPTISTSARIFTGEQNASTNTTNTAILYEIACARSENCNVDQKAYLTRLVRALANARDLGSQSSSPDADSVVQRITTILQTSASAAAAQCTGGDSGTACGGDWTSREFGGETGLGEDLNALEVMLANLPAKEMRTAENVRNGTTTGSTGGNGTGIESPASPTSAASALDILSSSTLAFLLAVSFGVVSFFA